jgi:hypothetical protein
MGAKIVLTGRAKDIRREEQIVSFDIVTGPPTRHPPRGLKLFGRTHYQVQCTARQWRRARYDPNDDSDLVVEGYLEPRRDAETGQMVVAVVAMSVESKLLQNARKLQGLEEHLEACRDAFKQARESEAPREMLEERAAAFVKANEALCEFLARHPDLAEAEP